MKVFNLYTKTSITILPHKSFDIGPVITQEAVDLPSESTTSYQLLDYLGNIGNQMVLLKLYFLYLFIQKKGPNNHFSNFQRSSIYSRTLIL